MTRPPAFTLEGPPPVCMLLVPPSPLTHSPLSGRTPFAPPIVCPPFDSAASVIVQPAAVLRHVQGHRYVRHVSGALRSCPGSQPQSDPPRACRPLPPSPLHALQRASLARIICVPSLRLGRAQAPCPPPTSCSSVAHGRAPRPSPVLAMARAGLREAAPEDRRLHVCS